MLNKHEILNLPNVDNSRFEAQLQAYLSLVSHWNSLINIVSTRNVDNLLIELVQQSLVPLFKEPLPRNSRLLDVGSGGGIPAVPLKLARPDLRLTLLEPRRKKCLFLQRVIEALALTEVEVVHTRLEDFAHLPDQAGSFDLVTTRGTGSAALQFPLIATLVKPGGRCWFYKGLSAAKETEQLRSITDKPVRLTALTDNLALVIVEF